MNPTYFDLTAAADALPTLPAEASKPVSRRVILDGGIVIYLHDPPLIDGSAGGMGVDFQWLPEL